MDKYYYDVYTYISIKGIYICRILTWIKENI